MSYIDTNCYLLPGLSCWILRSIIRYSVFLSIIRYSVFSIYGMPMQQERGKPPNITRDFTYLDMYGASLATSRRLASSTITSKFSTRLLLLRRGIPGTHSRRWHSRGHGDSIRETRVIPTRVNEILQLPDGNNKHAKTSTPRCVRC